MSETLPLNRIYLGKGIRLTGGQPAFLASEIGCKNSPGIRDPNGTRLELLHDALGEMNGKRLL